MTTCRIKLTGQVVQGQGHARNNKPCQDRIFVKQYNNIEGYIALADGAGSCARSDIGAQICVRSVGEIIRKRFGLYYRNPGLLKRQILRTLINLLKKKAASANLSIREFSSTLLFVYSKKVNTRVYYISGHIGDGLIIMEHKRDVKIISYPENGEYINSTYFVTSHNAMEHLRINKGFVEGNAGFLLISDGTAEALYHRQSRTLAPACGILFEWVKRYKELKVFAIITKNLEHVIKNKTTDDCGLAMIYIQQRRSVCNIL